MYIQAQISIVSALLTIAIGLIGYSSSMVGVFMLILMIIYTAYALKRIYKFNFFEIIVRTLLFGVVLAITFVILIVVVFIFMYLNGDVQEMIEAQRATKEATQGSG